jgi:hypothetical protein
MGSYANGENGSPYRTHELTYTSNVRSLASKHNEKPGNLFTFVAVIPFPESLMYAYFFFILEFETFNFAFPFSLLFR